jgi:hypothetical protein
VFTRARHWTLSWARWTQYTLPHPIWDPLQYYPPIYADVLKHVSSQEQLKIPSTYVQYECKLLDHIPLYAVFESGHMLRMANT